MLDNGPHTVTCVTPDDQQLLAAVRLGDAMWAESRVYGNMARSVDKMIEFAYYARASDHSFFRVAVHDDRVIGFMIGEVAPYGFHDTSFAYDRLLYVSPDRRGGAAARMLIAAFEQWAQDKGASRILLGITTGTHTDATERFYNKLGYNTVGVLTMKEIS